MRGLVGIVGGALCALAIACGAAQKSASAPPPVMATPNAEMARGTPRDQIDQLDQQISHAREQMGLGPVQPNLVAPAPACVGNNCAAEQMGRVECPAPPTETCTNSCTLKDSICDNATKICELAKQLPGDAWATGKCNAGQTSCKEATERCCACR